MKPTNEQIYELANFIYFRTHDASKDKYFKFTIPLSATERRYIKYAELALEFISIRGAK